MTLAKVKISESDCDDKHVVFNWECPINKGKICIIGVPITKKDDDDLVWDGNKENPTIAGQFCCWNCDLVCHVQSGCLIGKMFE